MELIDYLRLLRRSWWLVALLTVVGVALGGVYAATATKKYTATSEAFVGVGAGVTTDAKDASQAQNIKSSSDFVLARMSSYTGLVRDPDVYTAVKAKLALTETQNHFNSTVTVTTPVNSVLLLVHVTDKDAALSAKIANETIAQLATVIDKLETPPGATASQVSVSVTRNADTPTAPTSPRKSLALALGLIVGLGLGLLGAAIRDQAVRSKELLAGPPVVPVAPVAPVASTTVAVVPAPAPAAEPEPAPVVVPDPPAPAPVAAAPAVVPAAPPVPPMPVHGVLPPPPTVPTYTGTQGFGGGTGQLSTSAPDAPAPAPGPPADQRGQES